LLVCREAPSRGPPPVPDIAPSGGRLPQAARPRIARFGRTSSKIISGTVSGNHRSRHGLCYIISQPGSISHRRCPTPPRSARASPGNSPPGLAAFGATRSESTALDSPAKLRCRPGPEMPRHRRWPSLNPRARAFCRRAPAVRFIALAIFFTGDLFRECAFSSRTSCFDQVRRFVRLARFFAIPPSRVEIMTRQYSRSSIVYMTSDTNESLHHSDPSRASCHKQNLARRHVHGSKLVVNRRTAKALGLYQHRYLQTKFLTALSGFSELARLSLRSETLASAATLRSFFFGGLSAITMAQKVL